MELTLKRDNIILESIARLLRKKDEDIMYEQHYSNEKLGIVLNGIFELLASSNKQKEKSSLLIIDTYCICNYEDTFKTLCEVMKEHEIVELKLFYDNAKAKKNKTYITDAIKTIEENGISKVVAKDQQCPHNRYWILNTKTSRQSVIVGNSLNGIDGRICDVNNNTEDLPEILKTLKNQYSIEV